MVEHVREFSEFGMSEDVLLRDLHFKLKEFANVSYLIPDTNQGIPQITIFVVTWFPSQLIYSWHFLLQGLWVILEYILLWFSGTQSSNGISESVYADAVPSSSLPVAP